MKVKIENASSPALEFAPSSKEREVIQNILIILNTPKYSVPGYREFGVDMSYLHYPAQIAKTKFVAAMNDAIKKFEPRAHLDGVTFDDSESDTLKPILEVTIDE